MQSKAVHARLCKRIHWLLDLTLHNMTRALIDEQRARNRLAEFPKLILYDLLTDINLTQEPFFRSLLRGAARASLRECRASAYTYLMHFREAAPEAADPHTDAPGPRDVRRSRRDRRATARTSLHPVHEEHRQQAAGTHRRARCPLR